MNDSKTPREPCRNVFKNGRMPTKEEYTRFWIQLINQMERLKNDG